MRITALLLIVALSACSKVDSPTAKETQPTAAPLISETAGGINGTVVEVVDVPVYTYLRLKTTSGDVWAAIPTRKVAVGDSVTLVNPQPMANFTSKTLNRTFDVIQFASGIAGASSPLAPSAPSLMMPSTPSGETSTPKDVQVGKATGADAKTVAELYAEKAALKDKPVEVRGKVVKVSPAILGKNWLHVRDGSGSDAAKNNDLVVSTADSAEVGATLVVRGTVRINREVGTGLSYPLLIEDAKLTR